jgi:hypothetical protein
VIRAGEKPRFGPNGAIRTSSATIPIDISYTYPTSPPWAGDDGRAANWVCIALNQDCTPTTISPDCSMPSLRRTGDWSNCELTVRSSGRYYVCVKGADSAVPDTSSINQFADAEPANPNISAVTGDAIDVRLPSGEATPPVQWLVRNVAPEGTVRDLPPGLHDTLDVGDGGPRTIATLTPIDCVKPKEG